MGDDTEDIRTEKEKIDDARKDGHDTGYDKGYWEGAKVAKENTRRETLSILERIGEELDNTKILTAVTTLRVVWGL